MLRKSYLEARDKKSYRITLDELAASQARVLERARLEAMGVDELEVLRTALKQTRRWSR